MELEECGKLGRIQPEYVDLLREYCSAMERHFAGDLISICVFGSVARGESEPSSDIDVMVVAENLPQDAGERTRSTNYIHEALKKTDARARLKSLGRSTLISDIFLTPQEVQRHPPILIDMVEDAVILYDRGGFIRKVLTNLKEKLEKMGARRISTKRGYLWILKPNIKPSEVVEV
ncbi:nucleotidyltransferase domain-containing protein [Candidatus Bathyarchaeota archaeon]|nr:nucleotidyltransferase domain-containing protein [Candidatus Bathyarchaeota archaeon]